MGCIHSDTAHLAKEVAWPISAFGPRAVAGEIPPLRRCGSASRFRPAGGELAGKVLLGS
jgi:hypothetical protein